MVDIMDNMIHHIRKNYMIYGLVLVIIIIMMILSKAREGFTSEEEHKENNESLFIETPLESKMKLFQALAVFHMLCEKHDMWYVITFGSLLGAVRHRNMIPWDDDMDVLVKLKDINKLRIILKEMNKLGYKTEETIKLFRVYTDPEENHKYFIDFFIIDDSKEIVNRCLTNNDNKCYYPSKTDPGFSWYHNFFRFKSEYLKNRKKYQFGPLCVWGSTNSNELLTQWYGDNYLTTCKTHFLKNHSKRVKQHSMKCSFGEPQF